jgi:hypothetical protein
LTLKDQFIAVIKELVIKNAIALVKTLALIAPKNHAKITALILQMRHMDNVF